MVLELMSGGELFDRIIAKVLEEYKFCKFDWFQRSPMVYIVAGTLFRDRGCADLRPGSVPNSESMRDDPP